MEPLANGSALGGLMVPDLWQQQAITALRAGRDVVVQAPTGAGKTLIFELWSNHGKGHGQAIYTVPTRALANDKLAEWRARGWNVGITTGDMRQEPLGAHPGRHPRDPEKPADRRQRSRPAGDG